MLIRFGLCLDPDDTASASIVQKAMASINPDLGKTVKESRARQALRVEILRDVQQVDTRPTKGVLPDFGRNWDRGSRHIVLVPARELHQIIRKWVRGLHYSVSERLISALTEDRRISRHRRSRRCRVPGHRTLRTSIYQAARGVGHARASATEGKNASTIYHFVLWDQYKVCAAVSERL